MGRRGGSGEGGGIDDDCRGEMKCNSASSPVAAVDESASSYLSLFGSVALVLFLEHMDVSCVTDLG